MTVYHSEGGAVSQVREAEYESVTQAIVAAVAELKNCRGDEIPELFGATNPEALNKLFDGSESEEDLTLELTIGEFVVHCEKRGMVTIKRLERFSDSGYPNQQDTCSSEWSSHVERLY